MRIIVCGSRNWTDRLLIEDVLLAYGRPASNVTIVHGAARGADTIAHQIAVKHGWNTDEYPADWKTHGRAAGPIRNQQMIDSGADLVIAFTPTPGEGGTGDTCRRAHQAGIPVIEIPLTIDVM